MSGALSCSAVQCVHNLNGLCAAYKIHVTGATAYTSSQTGCETFAQKGIVNAITNLTNMNVPGEIRQLFNNSEISMSPKIECDAVKCTYNSNKICTANRVQVMGSHASTSEATQCETFVD